MKKMQRWLDERHLEYTEANLAALIIQRWCRSCLTQRRCLEGTHPMTRSQLMMSQHLYEKKLLAEKLKREKWEKLEGIQITRLVPSSEKRAHGREYEEESHFKPKRQMVHAILSEQRKRKDDELPKESDKEKESEVSKSSAVDSDKEHEEDSRISASEGSATELDKENDKEKESEVSKEISAEKEQDITSEQPLMEALSFICGKYYVETTSMEKDISMEEEKEHDVLSEKPLTEDTEETEKGFPEETWEANKEFAEALALICGKYYLETACMEKEIPAEEKQEHDQSETFSTEEIPAEEKEEHDQSDTFSTEEAAEADKKFAEVLGMMCRKYYIETTSMEKEEALEIAETSRLVEEEVPTVDSQWRSIDLKNKIIRDLAILNSFQSIIRIHLELLKLREKRSIEARKGQLLQLNRSSKELLPAETQESEVTDADFEKELWAKEEYTLSQARSQLSLERLLSDLPADIQAKKLKSIASLQDLHSPEIEELQKHISEEKQNELPDKTEDELWETAHNMCCHLEELAEGVKLLMPRCGSYCRNVMRQNLGLLREQSAVVANRAWWTSSQDQENEPLQMSSQLEKQQSHGVFIYERLSSLLQDLERETCAVIIQSWWRMKLEKKRYKELKEQKQQQMEEAALAEKKITSRKEFSKWVDETLAQEELIKVAGLSTELQTILYNINICLEDIRSLVKEALSRYPNLAEEINELFNDLQMDLAALVIHYWWYTVQQKKHLMKFVKGRRRTLFGHALGVQQRVSTYKQDLLSKDVPASPELTSRFSRNESCECPWETLDSLNDAYLEEKERNAVLIQRWWRQREGMELLSLNKDLLQNYDVIVHTYREKLKMLIEDNETQLETELPKFTYVEYALVNEMVCYVEPCHTYVLEDINVPGQSCAILSEDKFCYAETIIVPLEDDFTIVTQQLVEQESTEKEEAAPLIDTFDLTQTLEALGPSGRKCYRDFLVDLKKHFAAIKIQIWWYLVKSQKSKNSDFRKMAILKVFFYMYILRKRLIALQKNIEGEIAAITIQAWWRAIKQKKSSTIPPQDIISVVKDIVACGLYCKSALAELTDEREALTKTVSNMWKFTANPCDHYEAAVIKLQACCRGYLARKNFRDGHHLKTDLTFAT